MIKACRYFDVESSTIVAHKLKVRTDVRTAGILAWQIKAI